MLCFLFFYLMLSSSTLISRGKVRCIPRAQQPTAEDKKKTDFNFWNIQRLHQFNSTTWNTCVIILRMQYMDISYINSAALCSIIQLYCLHNANLMKSILFLYGTPANLSVPSRCYTTNILREKMYIWKIHQIILSKNEIQNENFTHENEHTQKKWRSKNICARKKCSVY